jgi:hypothetical protein
VQALKLGATYALACKYAGIHVDTFIEWRKHKVEFSEAVEKAEGDAVVGWLAVIQKAAQNNEWTAAAWKLERRYPQDYGRQKVDVAVQHSGTVRHEHVDLTKLSDAELTHLERLVATAGASPDPRRN